jgi:uncharacterized protein
MLTLDVAELERRGRLPVKAVLATDLPAWEGTEFTLVEPVVVDLEAQATTTGEVLVRGTVKTRVGMDCRRCLEPVERDLDEEVSLLFSPPDQLDPEDRGGEVRLLLTEGNLLELTEAIREEILLAAPRWVLCDPECKGLCPKCGANWNVESCDCTFDEPDPRWAALRALTEEK